ncbi:MAG: 30S ribosomal protein S7, partial [Omnitrophica WOR_2 bacterium GWA2_47_8]
MRRRKAEKRETIPDAKYSSPLIAKFISMLMVEGKRTVAEKIVYEALEILKQKLPDDQPLKAFNKAIDNVRPRLELKPRRVGGATYQIPVEVNVPRGNSLALRWIRDFARNKKGKAMITKLADELVSAYKGEGP